MRLSPQLVMLTVMGIAGSVLFAAESSRQAQQRAVAMAPAAEVDKDKKLPNATDPVTGKPAEPAKGDSTKSDAAKAEPAKAEAAKTSKDAAADPAAAADKSAADKAAATAKSSKSDADRAATPQRFVPSEEVRADFDVSFPVDI